MELQVLTGVLVFCGPGKYSQIRRHLRVHLWVSGRRDAGIFAALGKDMPLSGTEIRKSKVGPKAYKRGALYLDHLSRWQVVAMGLQTQPEAENDDLRQVPGRVFGDGSRSA